MLKVIQKDLMHLHQTSKNKKLFIYCEILIYMGISVKNIENFLGYIVLTKNYFFGMKKEEIVIVITPNLKSVKITSSRNRLPQNFPFKKFETISLDNLKKWSKKNSFSIRFSTNNSILKRELYYNLDDVLIDKSETKKKSKKYNFNVFITDKKNVRFINTYL